MNAPDLIVRRLRRATRTPPRSDGTSYRIALTDTGKWLHSIGSDFLFAYLETGWPAEVQAAITDAFETALGVSAAIKDAVRKTGGHEVVNGFYLLNDAAMTKAMHSIPGMGLTAVNSYEESGCGTAETINAEFFAGILEGLGGDVMPMLDYLTASMSDMQAQCRESTVTEIFGTVIGIVSPMPVLNVPVTTFQYVFSSSAVASWFGDVNCERTLPEAYDYSYTVAAYDYDPA